MKQCQEVLINLSAPIEKATQFKNGSATDIMKKEGMNNSFHVMLLLDRLIMLIDYVCYV